MGFVYITTANKRKVICLLKPKYIDEFKQMFLVKNKIKKQNVFIPEQLHVCQTCDV